LSDTRVVDREGDDDDNEGEEDTGESTDQIGAFPILLFFSDYVHSMGKSVVLSALTRFITIFFLYYRNDFFLLKVHDEHNAFWWND